MYWFKKLIKDLKNIRHLTIITGINVQRARAKYTAPMRIPIFMS